MEMLGFAVTVPWKWGCPGNSILSHPQKWKKESWPIPVSMGLQIRHELKINWGPRWNRISRIGNKVKVHWNKNCPEHFYTKFWILKVTHFGKELPCETARHVHHADSCSLLQWSLTWAGYAGKEGACLASTEQFPSNNKRIPSLPPSSQQGDAKDDSEKALSPRETPCFQHAKRLIRQSTEATICRKFRSGQETGNDSSCAFEIPWDAAY